MSMMSILREVRDPRDPNAQHVLAEMLFVVLAATLCGAKGFVQIAEFGEARLADLREIVPLEHGMASHELSAVSSGCSIRRSWRGLSQRS